jgi:hypothetical protein
VFAMPQSGVGARNRRPAHPTCCTTIEPNTVEWFVDQTVKVFHRATNEGDSRLPGAINRARHSPKHRWRYCTVPHHRASGVLHGAMPHCPSRIAENSLEGGHAAQVTVQRSSGLSDVQTLRSNPVFHRAQHPNGRRQPPAKNLASGQTQQRH